MKFMQAKLWGCVLLLLSTGAAWAEHVELARNQQISLLADYLPGDKQKPAVLLLHGFLQTYQFPTVRRLGDALAEAGYPVLLPTLSLNLDRRQTSLGCEAIHTHSLEDDLQEIGLWIDWLAELGYQRIVLVGHSFGSLQLAAYLQKTQDKRVQALVLISLVHAEQNVNNHPIDYFKVQAEQQAQQAPTMPAKYPLSFCPEYLTLPKMFLSYIEWGRARLTEVLTQTAIPTYVIIGSEDNRIDPEWIQLLKAPQLSLSTIEGANHFFDQEHEFDIQDRIETILNNLP